MSRPYRPYRLASQRSRLPHAQPRRSRPPQAQPGSYLIALAVIVMLTIGGAYAYQRVFGAINKISSAQDVRVLPTPSSSEPPPALLQQPFTLLVIGVDMRENAEKEGVRSDTLIVARVDPVEKWVSLLSIPRDTVVYIPSDECATQKINAAYSCGYANPDLYEQADDPRDSGAALAAETVENYLGITIDHTMQVDFNGFQQLVDALGGVTVDVPRAILDPEYPTENDGYMRLYYPAGLQRMNGEQALRYARTRHADNDFGRAQRQQQVVQAGIDELKRQDLLQLVETAPKLLDALSDSVRTTLPVDNLATLRGLAQFAQDLDSDRVRRLVLQPETLPDGRSTLLGDYNNVRWDPQYVRRVVREWETAPGEPVMYDAEDDDGIVTVQVQNGTLQRSLATQVTTDLDVRGFRMASPADAPSDDALNTLIIDYTGNEATVRELAEALDVDEQYIRTQPDEPAPENVDIVVRLGNDYEPQIDTSSSGN